MYKAAIIIGILERKEREKEEMQDKILQAARKLMSIEGEQGVSIRKIAGMIEYSPANIYHYFKNKDEIIERIMSDDYRMIMHALSSLQTKEKTPEEKLRESAASYISLAVEMGDSYKNMMKNSSPSVLAHTSVLYKGAAAERPSIAMLCAVLREFPALSGSSEAELEAAAQVIWSVAFGLSMRFIVEKVEEQQRMNLINWAIDLIVRSLESDNEHANPKQ
ncbi:MAG TPA: TetR/AcrR family transcriptional regulator [Ruminiclostridium sp.]|nr:TetR/AcrR family transcriptional regulator [Ruminiclostridium sp.]